MRGSRGDWQSFNSFPLLIQIDTAFTDLAKIGWLCSLEGRIPFDLGIQKVNVFLLRREMLFRTTYFNMAPAGVLFRHFLVTHYLIKQFLKNHSCKGFSGTSSQRSCCSAARILR